MRSVDEMIAALEAAGWNVSRIECRPDTEPGNWRATADKLLPSKNWQFLEAYGDTVYEAVRRLCRDCLGEGWK